MVGHLEHLGREARHIQRPIFDGSKMEDIALSGNSISFSRIIGVPDENGEDTQMWSGQIGARDGGGVGMRGTWTGAFLSVAQGADIANWFVAVLTG